MNKDPRLLRSPRVKAAIELLQRLLANGVSISSNVIRQQAAALGIPEPTVRVAHGHLGVVADPHFREQPSGKKVIAGWTWRLPTPPTASPLLPLVRAAPADDYQPPPETMSPAARSECFKLNGRWTHPLGDEEYRRLCAGGTPLPRTATEPWLQRPKR